MRPRADAERINAFLRELGRAARVPTRLYLTGGATAVVEGWRGATVDIHLHLEDVHAMIDSSARRSRAGLVAVRPDRARALPFPAIDPASFRARVERELA